MLRSLVFIRDICSISFGCALILVTSVIDAHAFDYANWAGQTAAQKSARLTAIINTLNVAQAFNPDRPIYCPPRSFRFTTEQLEAMLDEFVQARPTLKDLSVETIVVYAVSETFTCETKQPT